MNLVSVSLTSDLGVSLQGVSSEDFYVVRNGHRSDLEDPLQHGAIYHLEPRLCGGKGGQSRKYTDPSVQQLFSQPEDETLKLSDLFQGSARCSELSALRSRRRRTAKPAEI